MFHFECNFVEYKINDIINKFLLPGDTFMPEMHLRQPQFSYSACRPFTKNKKRMQKFKETGDSRYIYRNELDEACFQHDLAYGDFKNLSKRTAVGKAFNIAKDPKYDGYQRGVASMVYNFLDKKTAVSGTKAMPQNEQLTKELHKPIIRKLKKKKSVFSIQRQDLGC